jgi:hypothetical protein
MRRNVRRSARRRAQPADGQLDLIASPPEGGWWRGHQLFTPSYIRQHLLSRVEAPSADDAQALYEFIRARWTEKLPAMRRRREPFTRSDFLDPVLREMGRQFIPEESLPDTQTRKTPDYCLFGDVETTARAAAGSGTDIFRAAHTVLEAKKA